MVPPQEDLVGFNITYALLLRILLILTVLVTLIDTFH